MRPNENSREWPSNGTAPVLVGAFEQWTLLKIELCLFGEPDTL